MQKMHTFALNDPQLVGNPKVIQIGFELILRCKAGVHEEAFFTIPFFETTVVEWFQIVLDNEGDNIML